MNSVDKIDIRVTRRAEQDCVARGAARGGMGGGVIGAEVGFGFNNATGQNFAVYFPEYDFAEEIAGDHVGCGVVEVTRQRQQFSEFQCI